MMLYHTKNASSPILLWRLSKSYNGLIRWVSAGQPLFASEKDDKNATKPPLKFSESAAFVPRREREYGERPLLSVGPLTFWEDMSAKRDSYRLLNRGSFLFSLVVFMGYFFILREENDLDEELVKPLWKRLPSLEEQVLHERIMLGKNKDEDVTEYEKRYNELLQEKQQEQDRLLKKP